MADQYVNLDYLPTTALKEWIDAHLYYLPEAIKSDECISWCKTMNILTLELNKRQISVKGLNLDISGE